MDFVISADILIYLMGDKTPSPEEITWADACASAVNSGITVRLNGAVIDNPSDAYDELHLAAIIAGGETFKRKEAPFGLTGYADMEGNAVRLAKDYLEAIRP